MGRQEGKLQNHGKREVENIGVKSIGELGSYIMTGSGLDSRNGS